MDMSNYNRNAYSSRVISSIVLLEVFASNFSLRTSMVASKTKIGNLRLTGITISDGYLFTLARRLSSVAIH